MFFTDVIQSDNPPSSSRAHRSMIHFPFSHFPPQARIQTDTSGTYNAILILVLHLKINLILLGAEGNPAHLQQNPVSYFSSPLSDRWLQIPLIGTTLLQKNTLTSIKQSTPITSNTVSVLSYYTKYKNTKAQKLERKKCSHTSHYLPYLPHSHSIGFYFALLECNIHDVL